MTVVWEFVPDLAARRRALRRLRLGLLGVSVAAVGLSLGRFGLLGGLIALAVVSLIAMSVESWGRSVPDAGPQRLWVEGDVLHAEGPEVYGRAPGADAFELELDGPAAVVDLDEVTAVAVYPSTTRLDDVTPAPPKEFHLVVDLWLRDGGRRCVVFDRRLPFRIRGERSLADAMVELVGGGPTEPDVDDAFGEVDTRRLADWTA